MTAGHQITGWDELTSENQDARLRKAVDMNETAAAWGAEREVAKHAAEHNRIAYAQVYATLSVAAAIDRLATTLAARGPAGAGDHESYPRRTRTRP